MGQVLRLRPKARFPPEADDAPVVCREVDLLIEIYGATAGPQELVQMAQILEDWAGSFPVGADRARLWARTLRERSSAKPAEPEPSNQS